MQTNPSHLKSLAGNGVPVRFRHRAPFKTPKNSLTIKQMQRFNASVLRCLPHPSSVSGVEPHHQYRKTSIPNGAITPHLNLMKYQQVICTSFGATNAFCAELNSISYTQAGEDCHKTSSVISSSGLNFFLGIVDTWNIDHAVAYQWLLKDHAG